MVRLVILLILFLASLLTRFRAPTNLLWYVAILVTEFCWVFILLAIAIVFWKAGTGAYQIAGTVAGLASIVFFALPILGAYRTAQQLKKDFAQTFPTVNVAVDDHPFRPAQMITGIARSKTSFKTFEYDATNRLHLDFYQSSKEGTRPCVVVVHGGSWAAGDSKQLPELNSELAKEGYHVASINYRLAPGHHYPAPIEDVHQALRFLKKNWLSLQINTSQFILLGRSAGGQIALSAAYTLHEPTIKGVICFYGPTDMVWGFENPTSPLLMDSRKVMKEYIGGTLAEKKDQYLHSSATETVTTKTPPTLLIYAENDPLVSPRHGNRLSVKLKEQNIPFFGLYLPWATHAFDYTLNGPGGQLSTWTVKHFLKAILQ